MRSRTNTPLIHAAILLVALSAMWRQLADPGYYMIVNFDAAIGPKFTLQFMESFRQGIYYPRWMANSYHGLGSPAFVYYSPILYFLTSILSMTGIGMPQAFSVVYLAGLYFGGACMFHLIRKRYGGTAGIISGICFILLPTRIADFYLLNTLAGRFAQAWLPVVLLSVDRYMEGPFKRTNLAVMAAAYAGLVMSHIATAYIFTPFIIAFGLLVSYGPIDWKGVLRLTGGLLSGICLAAVYFLPMLLERGYIQTKYFLIFHDFSNFFIFDILTAHETVQIEEMLSIMRHTVVLEICVITGILYLWWRNAKQSGNREVYFYICSAAASLFMMSSPSAVLWEVVPGISTVQYPARFGALFVTFISALIGIVVPAITGRTARPKAAVITAGIVFIVIMLFDAFLIVNSPRYTQDEAVAVGARIDLPEYIPEAAQLDVIKKASNNMPLFSSEGDFSTRIERWGYDEKEFTVESVGPLKLVVKTFWFPGWRAWVDGKETRIGVEKGTGAMLIELLPGRHKVELRFTNTPVRSAGAAISLLTVILLLLPYGRLSALLGRD